MNQAQRVRELKEIFANQEFVEIEHLCSRFQASKSAIRRDLMELERRKIIERVRGGALSLLVREGVLDLLGPPVSCEDVHKARIGRLAALQVKEGQTVLLGGGSTALETARNLKDRAIQIVTNSIPVAKEFWDSKQAEVILTGGFLYPRFGVQLGPICEQMLRGVSADLLIMGIHGITSAGISDSNTLVVESLRAMIEAARKVVIVADSSKFGRNALLHVAGLDKIDLVVSDKDLPVPFQSMLEQHEVEYMLA